MINAEDGKEVTDQDFRGKFMVLYFGFTHCPDVCPDELEKMSKVITKLDAIKGVGENITPVFISVDPKRDTPEAVRQYIKGIISLLSNCTYFQGNFTCVFLNFIFINF